MCCELCVQWRMEAGNDGDSDSDDDDDKTRTGETKSGGRISTRTFR